MRGRAILFAGLTGLSAGVASKAEPAGKAAWSRAATSADVDDLLGDLGQDEDTARHRLAAIDKEREALQRLTVVRGRAYVRMARAGLLPVGGGFDALVDHAVRLERLRRALARDLELEGTLAKQRIALNQRLEELKLKRDVLQTERGALARSREAILAAQERDLAFHRAFEGGWEPDSHTAVYGAGLSVDTQPQVSGGLSSMKGRLPFPIAGRVEINSVRLKDATGPGLVMMAPHGSAVRAIFAGRVAFADDYASYGRTVILDHGEQHYTVTAQLGSLDVRVGDELKLGDRLGTVGMNAGRASVYVEIRTGTKTVSPEPWFGL